MAKFCHLHCHTDYSLLDGAAKAKDLVLKTKELGMNALAITDHGNMFGVPQFVNTAQQHDIKPIIGCEFYLAPDRLNHNDKTRYHQVLLAKDSTGYKNLSRLCSLGFTEGYHYKPRIDKALLKKHVQGLIATTCCISGEIPQAILHEGEKEAEKRFLWWLELFDTDYYIELQRHGINKQETCNQVLLKWAKKHGVKVIATNDVHYVEQSDSVAQDILLCLQTGKDYNDPKRMRFESNQFFLKSPQDMQQCFEDVPEALYNTLEIVSKVKTPSLERDVLLPIFQPPEGFSDQGKYLHHLAFSGLKKRYNAIDDKLTQRLNYELDTINAMGFAGYFLVIQDLVNAARKLDVVVGPGRGSVAGSVVAYCLGITDIDPLRYNLFFERFLNPERVSMPDIDIDLDHEGRSKVIDYIANKYGRNQVGHIITFGSIAAKSAIRDVARVLGLPLDKTNYLAKLVPDKPGITLAQAFKDIPELAQRQAQTNTTEAKVLTMATKLEGVVRHTGIHAAGIIIAPDDLDKYIPVKKDKDTNLLVTQYDGSLVERMGMLKIDCLGLKTLSIMKNALSAIEQRQGKRIDLNTIPLDDPVTFKLYQEANTIGTFQFESEGMRQWLVKLKPTNMEHLVAMNALHRPGPIDFIKDFVARKHGQESISYPHRLLEAILSVTYGIMVYQEQVMQTAQIISGYSLSEADLLRRAMGKKKPKEMAKQRERFIQGAIAKHKITEKKASEIFSTVEKFAQYGFPRAHSAAYALLAYQTAYLKANYPAEYMAAVLTNHQHESSKVTVFIEACKQQNLHVLGPDINESGVDFNVNSKGQIRFGLGAIKGAGTSAAQEIIKERQTGGDFRNIFDFTERVRAKSINKKLLESLALSGAFDCFPDHHRKQYIHASLGDSSLIDKAIQHGQKTEQAKSKAQQSLFSGTNVQTHPRPKAPKCTPYTDLERLKLEKDTIGFYVSGHPLDAFELERKHFCNAHTQNALQSIDKEVRIGGILSSCIFKQGSGGREFGLLRLEDQKGALEMRLFGDALSKHQHLLQSGNCLYVIGDIKKKYKQEDVYELKPKGIRLLADIKTHMAKALHLTLSVSAIEPDLIAHLEEVINAYPGEYTLRMRLVAHKEGLEVKTHSKRYQINPVHEFLHKLDDLKGVQYTFKLTGAAHYL